VRSTKKKEPGKGGIHRGKEKEKKVTGQFLGVITTAGGGPSPCVRTGEEVEEETRKRGQGGKIRCER